MLTTTSLFLAQRFYGYHPFAAFLFYLLFASVCVGILLAVANSRGRSSLWSLFGVWLLPGLLIGLLVLIALPANTEPPAQNAA
ncbi:MAG: hypothetical protein U0837_15010 [Dehalococcoidia bacterium]|jgi:hypothetical protein